MPKGISYCATGTWLSAVRFRFAVNPLARKVKLRAVSASPFRDYTSAGAPRLCATTEIRIEPFGSPVGEQDTPTVHQRVPPVRSAVIPRRATNRIVQIVRATAAA